MPERRKPTRSSMQNRRRHDETSVIPRDRLTARSNPPGAADLTGAFVGIGSIPPQSRCSSRQIDRDEEVAALCDIERDGATRPEEERAVEGLAGRGLIDIVFQGSSKRLNLTPHAHRLLSERSVGLNES
jgi:hypothetical protein